MDRFEFQITLLKCFARSYWASTTMKLWHQYWGLTVRQGWKHNTHSPTWYVCYAAPTQMVHKPVSQIKLFKGYTVAAKCRTERQRHRRVENITRITWPSHVTRSTVDKYSDAVRLYEQRRAPWYRKSAAVDLRRYVAFMNEEGVIIKAV